MRRTTGRLQRLTQTAALRIPQGRAGERGSVLPTVLVVTAVVSLLLVPLLQFAGAALARARSGDTALANLYSADAATEDALWRLWYDTTFRQAVLSATPQVYVVNVNGQDVTVNTQLYVPSDPTPTPAPTPTPKPGNSPLSWTMMSPASVNLAANPNPTVRVTYYLHNPSSAQATVTEMKLILPKGWVYVGNLAMQGLVDSQGGAFSLAELVPAAASCSTSSPPCWTYTGPDPYISCQNGTVNQTAGYQRLSWDWSQGRGNSAPRVDTGVLAQFSFDIQLSSQPQPGVYYDSPWTYVSQQQCGGNQLQAGGPSSVTLVLSLQMVSTSEDGTQDTTTRVSLSDTTRIELYSPR